MSKMGSIGACKNIHMIKIGDRNLLTYEGGVQYTSIIQYIHCIIKMFEFFTCPIGPLKWSLTSLQ